MRAIFTNLPQHEEAMRSWTNGGKGSRDGLGGRVTRLLLRRGVRADLGGPEQDVSFGLEVAQRDCERHRECQRERHRVAG